MRALLFAVLSATALSLCGTAVAGAADTATSQPSALPSFQHIDPNGVQNVSLITVSGKKLICHHQSHEGALLPQQICLTQQSWDRMRQQQQAMVSNWEIHSSGARR